MNQFLKAIVTDPLLGLLLPLLALIPIAAVLASLVKFYDVWKRYGYAIARSVRSPLTLLVGFLAWCLPLPFFNGWGFLALCFGWFVAHWAHDRERTEALVAAFGQLGLWVFRALRNLVRDRIAEAARVRGALPNSGKQSYATFAGLSAPPVREKRRGFSISLRDAMMLGGALCALAAWFFIFAPWLSGLTHPFRPSRAELEQRIEDQQGDIGALQLEKEITHVAIDGAENTHRVERHVAEAREQGENRIHEAAAQLDPDVLAAVYVREYERVWDAAPRGDPGDRDPAPSRFGGLHTAEAG